MIVVAADQHDGDAGAAAFVEKGVEHPLRLWRWHVGVVRIAAYKDAVDGFVLRDRQDFCEGPVVLLVPAPLTKELAEVPVAGVEKPHGASPRKGSPAGAAASLDRVAQAGKGNCTSSGTGISG